MAPNTCQGVNSDLSQGVQCLPSTPSPVIRGVTGPASGWGIAPVAQWALHLHGVNRRGVPPSHAELMFLQLLASPGLYWQEKPQKPLACSSSLEALLPLDSLEQIEGAQTLGVQLCPPPHACVWLLPMQGSRHLPGLLPSLQRQSSQPARLGHMTPWASQRQLLPCLACVPTAPAFCSTSAGQLLFQSLRGQRNPRVAPVTQWFWQVSGVPD